MIPALQSMHAFPNNMKFAVAATPLQESRTDLRIRTSVLVLYGAVTFVLLIACANRVAWWIVAKRRGTAIVATCQRSGCCLQ